MHALIVILGLALGFIMCLLVMEIVFDLLYQFSPAFRRWYRAFYSKTRG